MQARPGLDQGQVRLAGLAKAQVEGARQGAGRGDADPFGHRHHGGDAQVPHQALGQAADGRLGLRFGPLAGGEEDELGQAPAAAQAAEAANQVGGGDRGDPAAPSKR